MTIWPIPRQQVIIPAPRIGYSAFGSIRLTTKAKAASPMPADRVSIPLTRKSKRKGQTGSRIGSDTSRVQEGRWDGVAFYDVDEIANSAGLEKIGHLIRLEFEAESRLEVQND